MKGFIIYIIIMVGAIFAMFAGFAVGGVLFGDTLAGKLVGLLIAGLMILGLSKIGEDTGAL